MTKLQVPAGTGRSGRGDWQREQGVESAGWFLFLPLSSPPLPDPPESLVQHSLSIENPTAGIHGSWWIMVCNTLDKEYLGLVSGGAEERGRYERGTFLVHIAFFFRAGPWERENRGGKPGPGMLVEILAVTKRGEEFSSSAVSESTDGGRQGGTHRAAFARSVLGSTRRVTTGRQFEGTWWWAAEGARARNGQTRDVADHGLGWALSYLTGRKRFPESG